MDSHSFALLLATATLPVEASKGDVMKLRIATVAATAVGLLAVGTAAADPGGNGAVGSIGTVQVGPVSAAPSTDVSAPVATASGARRAGVVPSPRLLVSSRSGARTVDGCAGRERHGCECAAGGRSSGPSGRGPATRCDA